MKLYDGGRAPNPRRVSIYLAEKGIDVPREVVDMGALQHRSDAVSTLNPLQRLPVLELDDGTAITETIAICRYFEELHPEPALFGTGALEKAQIEMWQRRVEFGLLLQVANVFRHSHPAMVEWEKPQLAEFADANRPKVEAFCRFLNAELADREFIVGGAFSVADITALVGLDFMKPARLAIPDDCEHLSAYHDRLRARPSANA
ncbi:glutathione S-transferase family protein [Ahrensia sp. R2A130]|uniref:glutathione S-transferase family protein n=1 Tax=Ahrensia sp. R2A130 TaxID=744979 RepID=UPI0001E0F07D|nr:glutathione S-transferase [Ahrensia sp. R2A130]EFL90439.1 glutathione S-transferase 2 [Ahrensia sp. R2A130]